MAPLVPVIETARLLMRGPDLHEVEHAMTLWGDPAVTRFIGGQPRTREDTWGRFYRRFGHWWMRGFGSWSVFERAGGGFVGEVGFTEITRDIEPPIDDIPELGWVISPAAQGMGYATEAALAALSWIDAHLHPVRTVCLLDPENALSLRVAIKCGFREFARTRYKEQATLIMERP